MLKQITQVIAGHLEGVLLAEIAWILKLPRSTVIRCLPQLESKGILLWKNERGGLHLL